MVFNQLTGLSQVVGNWPGKTVKKAEGTARFRNYLFHIIDLPGIYSLSAYTLEEIITREYLVEEQPDYIINIIDCNHLERNLYLTMQLLLLKIPMVISLNQYDILKKRGYEIDIEKLSELLGVPVVPSIAVHNRGIHELLEKVIALHEHQEKITFRQFEYGKEIESRLTELIYAFETNFREHKCPARFAAIKFLENDEKCIESLNLEEKEGEELLTLAAKNRNQLEGLRGEQISTIINAEVYKITNNIARKVETIEKLTRKQKWSEIVDHVTLHSLWGYFILIVVLFGTYFIVFQFGNWISGLLDTLFEQWSPGAAAVLGGVDSTLYKIVWNGLFGSLIGGVGGVLPYVLPFFIVIEILQDIGYLPRAAYLMDHFMHRIGVHGKAIIPIILGFGCNVPAVTAGSILDTERERKRSILLSTMIPCSAVTTIVLGLVARYMGIGYAFLLYLVNFAAIVVIGKIITILDASIESELIIELHDFRVPNFKVIAKQTWHRSKDFVIIAMPLIVGLGAVMQILIELNLLNPINVALSPISIFLGLPVSVGAFLFYGVFRKELNLVLLENFVVFTLGITMTEYLSPIQMMVFTVVIMLYVPCLATLVTIRKEIGRKFMFLVLFIEVVTAIVVGGMIRWLFELLRLLGILSEGTAMLITFGVFFLLIILVLVILNSWKKKAEKKQKAGKQFLELKHCTNSCADCKGGSEPPTDK
ncbi:MAG: ferrous iron transport protein B [Candidatus Lokiarchaeota archaeon]|nr:ferrous iron transport protein B [Candidatus Lokiarchaeota archaeon]